MIHRAARRPCSFRQAWFLIFALLFMLFFAPRLAFAQETVVTLDPAHTQIGMTLDATLHTVHGNFKLKKGVIQFDPQTGKAQGDIVIDATSGDTGNPSRDKRMHQEVLESAKYPEITFLPGSIKGAIPARGSSQVPVAGVIRIHGEEHPLSFVADVDAPAGNRLHLKASFPIPYQRWGMKNPSNFLLHVSDTVEIEIDMTAQVSPGSGAIR